MVVGRTHVVLHPFLCSLGTRVSSGRCGGLRALRHALPRRLITTGSQDGADRPKTKAPLHVPAQSGAQACRIKPAPSPARSKRPRSSPDSGSVASSVGCSWSANTPFPRRCRVSSVPEPGGASSCAASSFFAPVVRFVTCCLQWGPHIDRRTIRCRHVRARRPVQNELVRDCALLSERRRWHVVGSQDEHADDLVASVVGNAADEVAGLERQRRFDDDVRARRSHEGLAE